MDAIITGISIPHGRYMKKKRQSKAYARVTIVMHRRFLFLSVRLSILPSPPIIIAIFILVFIIKSVVIRIAIFIIVIRI